MKQVLIVLLALVAASHVNAVAIDIVNKQSTFSTDGILARNEALDMEDGPKKGEREEFVSRCAKRMETLVKRVEKSYGAAMVGQALTAECDHDKSFDKKEDCIAFAKKVAKARTEDLSGKKNSYDAACGEWYVTRGAARKQLADGGFGTYYSKIAIMMTAAIVIGLGVFFTVRS
eukprot:TRINITY_DN63969_c0_g1_i1.p1 TRINITY_DN63969_c0_g1~~TRINITY_DN63969_c0_g1_i1.p1  ORF type:complete len:174 (+),score=53.84 TRINITY_DN63969_c0_g1_i1:126-647(+)